MIDVHTQELTRISHSQIMMWGDDEAGSTGCQQKWYLQHIARALSAPNAATPCGSAFHKAVEADGKAKMKGECLSYRELLEIACSELKAILAKEDPDGHLSNHTRENMLARVNTAIRKYVDKIQAVYKPIIIPESDFSLVVEDVRVTGIIDGQTEKAVTDWKLVKSQETYDHRPWIEGEGHYLQAGIYLLAHPEAAQVTFIVFAVHPDDPYQCQVTTYPVKRESLDFDAIRAKIVRVGHEIQVARESGAYLARTSKLCAWCPVLGSCKIGERWLKAAGLAAKVPVIHPGAKENLHRCPECGNPGRLKTQFQACVRDKGGSSSIPFYRLACDCGADWMLTKDGDEWVISDINKKS